METDQLKALKRLQKKNEHPRKVISDLSLDKLILIEAAWGNFQAPPVAISASIMCAAKWLFTGYIQARIHKVVTVVLSRRNFSQRCQTYWGMRNSLHANNEVVNFASNRRYREAFRREYRMNTAEGFFPI